jgi:hypothetical protein
VHIIEGKPAFSSKPAGSGCAPPSGDYDYQVMEKTRYGLQAFNSPSNGAILGAGSASSLSRWPSVPGFYLAILSASIPLGKLIPRAMLFSRALTSRHAHLLSLMRSAGHAAYTSEELGADDVVAVTVTEPEAPAPAPAPPSPTPELVNQAFVACGDAGLTGEGLDALVAELSQGEASQFDQLPVAVLDKLARLGVSAETVVRCNGATTILDDELPAAWSA